MSRWNRICDRAGVSERAGLAYAVVARRNVEQDLLRSWLIVEVALDEVLGPEPAMRGGICLHTLHIDARLRYSEELGYIRSTRTGIKPFTYALGTIADTVFQRSYARPRGSTRLTMIVRVCGYSSTSTRQSPTRSRYSGRPLSLRTLPCSGSAESAPTASRTRRRIGGSSRLMSFSACLA